MHSCSERRLECDPGESPENHDEEHDKEPRAVQVLHCVHVLRRLVFPHCDCHSYHALPSHQRNVTIGPIPHPSFDLVFNLHLQVGLRDHLFRAVVLRYRSMSPQRLAATLILDVCGQMEIMMSRMKNFVKDTRNNRTNSKRHMSIIVRHLCTHLGEYFPCNLFLHSCNDK